jgi:RNA 2',3'-cyclic 3'-phosphodiesterase
VPRLFVAIDLPEAIRATLSALRTDALAARWVEAEKLHLTLRFVGEVDQSIAEEIDRALRRVEALRFSLRLQGLSHFHKRTLWVGVENCPRLISLQAKIENAIQRAGLLADPSRYVPHVKVARLKWRGGRELRAFLDALAHFSTESFEVGEFSLIESRRSQQGATYHHRAAYALQPLPQDVPEAAAGS